MNQKNVVENIGIEIDPNYNDIEIKYNYDFESEKIKSLNKFPLKITTNNEFYLDDIYKNFSKSLNFNFHKCFAPKPKLKQSSKNPTPIIYEKQIDIYNLNTEAQIITEDAYSEKELSLDESSFSSDYENQIKETESNYINNDILNNNNQQIINNNNNNDITSKNSFDNNFTQKNEEKKIDINENRINSIEDEKENKSLKKYEHKTITAFPVKNNYNDNYTKGNIKAIRNSLFRAKLKCLEEKNKEVDYSIKHKEKLKYGLDIINNNSKKGNFDFYKVIPINDINKQENKNDIEDMSNFRKTISFNTSKINGQNKKNKEGKGITIYDVLLSNKKNKEK